MQGNVVNIFIKGRNERLLLTAFLFIDIHGLLQNVQRFW